MKIMYALLVVRRLFPEIFFLAKGELTKQIVSLHISGTGFAEPLRSDKDIALSIIKNNDKKAGGFLIS